MDTADDTALSDTATLPSRWARATEGDSEALRDLARSYWYSVYAWWRRAGLEEEQVTAVTLACFTRWLTESPPRLTDTGGGRMREWLRARLAELSAQGVELIGEATIAIEPAWAEELYVNEPEGEPDAIFERRWALTVLEFTMEAVRAEYAARGQEVLFAEVSPFAGFEGGDEESYTAAANRAGMTVGGMRKAVFDFRTRHREVLRAFVGDTVADPADLDSEITALLCACDAPGATPASMPTVIRQHKPDELLARAMRTVQMSSGGAGQWTPPSDAEIKRLFPQYEMLGMLGRGGMGAVYKARQIELDRLVAIKLLPLEISVDKEFADRFRREARAMAKLNHPNIIAVHDFGTTTEGHLYFAMEYVEGVNLADAIHGEGLSPEQTLSIAEQVCTALAYAHGKGIVHRDIKPANVMLSTEGQVKVADFGLARLTDPSAEQMGHTMTGTVMGTPDYMAPEQMRGMNVDHRADIYSLGVMLYEMLCKEVPKGIFDPPSHRTGCDARIDQIVIKAMNSSPDRRYQSTEELKADVTAARTPATMAVSGPTQVVHPQPVAKGALAASKGVAMLTIAPPGTKKSKLPLYAGIGAAILALIGGGIFLTKRDSKPLVVPKPELATPSPSATLEPGAIKLWDTSEKIPKEAKARREDGALVLEESQSLVFAEKKSLDGIVRATIRNRGRDCYVGLRFTGGWRDGSAYAISPHFNQGRVGLRRNSGGDTVFLKHWALPRPVAVNDWMQFELRAQGDELTVLADGKTLGSVRDSTLSGPGGVVIWGPGQSAFRDIVYVPLDKAGTTPAPAPTNEAWRDWIAEKRAEKTFFSRFDFEDDGKEVRSRFKSSASWAHAFQAADGAIRATWRLGPKVEPGLEEPLVRLRYTDLLQAGGGSYRAQITTTDVRINEDNHGELIPREIAKWPLPQGFDRSKEHTLELRAVGDLLSVKLNGEIIGQARDSKRTSGGFGFIGGKGSAIRKMEYLGLDPGSAASVPPSPNPTVSASPLSAAKDAPFVNSLGMKFVPVPITGGPTGGQRVLFSVWETRVQDYDAYTTETKLERSKFGFDQGPTYPAVDVRWGEATAFCAWLTERERKAGKLNANECYRLPSDHEWSCAVGIGTQEDATKTPEEKSEKLADVFPWGRDWPPPAGAGNFLGEENRAEGAPGATDKRGIPPGYTDGYERTAPVGSFVANSLGLYDLSGNVAEWCEDLIDEKKEKRVARGGAWDYTPRTHLLSSKRGHLPADKTNGGIGFRVVLAPVAPAAAAAEATVNAIDLLALVDVKRDGIAGEWKLVNGELLGSGNPFARLAFNYSPPDEYDFRIQFTRTSGNIGVSQHLARAGKDVMWIMGGFGNSAWGLEQVRGAGGNDNPTTIKSGLENGRRYESVAKVRRDRVLVEVDGRQVVDYKTDWSDFGVYRTWTFPDPKKLGVGCQQPTTFHRVEVSPVKPSAPGSASDSVKPTAATPAAPAVPAVQSATAKWLAEQEPQWRAAFAKEVSGPFEKGVADLKKQYLAALETQLAAATKAAKLDDAVALRTERDRLAGGGEVPAEDEALAPASLKILRASYRAAFAKLDTERFSRAKGVHARYDAILAQSQTALTQRQRLDEALEIKTQREALTAEWLKPPAGVASSVPAASAESAPVAPKPASGAATTSPPSKTPKLKPRELVERLLAMGATITGKVPGSPFVTVGNVAEFPGEKFEFDKVKFFKPREGLTEADLDILEQLGDIADLDLAGLPATDATIERLRRLPKLRALTLRTPNNITAAGFKAMAELPALQSLDMNIPITTEGLAALGKARQLNYLLLFGNYGTSFTEEDFAAIASIPALARLTLITNQAPPQAAWARLSSAKNLVDLTIGQVPASAAMIVEISKLSGLEGLTLGRITFPDAELAPLGALKSLQRLRTGKDSTLDGSVFATWSLRPDMKSLSLISQRSVSDNTLLAIVTAFPKLERLDVNASAESVTAAGFAHLTKLKQLSYLAVTGDALDDAGLAHLAKCELLYYLGLGNARVTEAGVQSLPKLSALRNLDWINPPVTESALKSYGKLRALTDFRIGPETTPEIEQKLKAALPKVKVVR